MTSNINDRKFLTRFAWISISAAIATMGLKALAYFLTGSVGLLSDALRSLVNLAGALMALAMLTVAARPADEDHAYGHSKAEYFSSGVEGTLILIAAVSIIAAAIPRLITPRPLEQVKSTGCFCWRFSDKPDRSHHSVTGREAISLDNIGSKRASFNDGCVDICRRAGRRGRCSSYRLGKIDPIVAFIVAANIIWSGIRIMPAKICIGSHGYSSATRKQEILEKVLKPYTEKGVQYHALRTRRSGSRRFASMHVLVPDTWTVLDGHQLLEKLEADIRHALRVLPCLHIWSRSTTPLRLRIQISIAKNHRVSSLL